MINIKTIFFLTIFIIIYLSNYSNELDYITNDKHIYINLNEKEDREKKNDKEKNTDKKNTNKKNTNKKNTNKKNTNKKKEVTEEWRDLAFNGMQNNITYNKLLENPSRQNLPIYYPIGSQLDDNYFNYLNSISSPKLSMLRTILRSVEVYVNQGIKPIIFNYADRPVEQKIIDQKRILTLANLIINLINKYSDSIMRVELDRTLNEVHEETDTQSKINFDMRIKLFYNDSETLGKEQKYDLIYIQQEFIFEKTYEILPEDQFFASDKRIDFKIFLSKLLTVGAEHNGFLTGKYIPIGNSKITTEFNYEYK